MRRGKYPFIVGFLIAPVTLYVVFVISPFVQAFYYSMTDWSGFSKKMNFVGLANYVILLSDPVFTKAVYNSIVLVLVILQLWLLTATMNAYLGGADGVVSEYDDVAAGDRVRAVRVPHLAGGCRQGRSGHRGDTGDRGGEGAEDESAYAPPVRKCHHLLLTDPPRGR